MAQLTFVCTILKLLYELISMLLLPNVLILEAARMLHGFGGICHAVVMVGLLLSGCEPPTTNCIAGFWITLLVSAGRSDIL